MEKEAKDTIYALSLLFYANQDCPDKIIQILENAFDEAVLFVFEHTSIDRTSDKEQFKQMLLKQLLIIIKKKLKE